VWCWAVVDNIFAVGTHELDWECVEKPRKLTVRHYMTTSAPESICTSSLKEYPCTPGEVRERYMMRLTNECLARRDRKRGKSQLLVKTWIIEETAGA
jgi:hypothetical protein